MELNYTKILARKILLTFLAFIIIFSVAALFLYNTITKRLVNIARLASNIEREQHRPERALLLLQEAESDFQQSLLPSKNKKSIDYKIKLSQAFDEVDALLKDNKHAANFTATQSRKIKLWRAKRTQLSAELFKLKHDFDSLLSAYANFNRSTALKPNDLPANLTSLKEADTIRKIIPAKKRGIFGRLKDAIFNKNRTTATKIIEIRPKDNLYKNQLAVKKAASFYSKAYSRKLQQLKEQNIRLLNMQRELISLNAHISNELKRINNGVKEINYNMSDELKGMAFNNYRDTTALLNKVHLAAIFLVLVFAGLLMLFIIQLNKSERYLRMENERSVVMAQQKMDLLHHMSHEIRNPLNAIKGFLYAFSATGLSKRQEEMLDSIKGSSDMLLHTLDDILNAAKMENSEFKIYDEPFNPDLTLREVIESMEYSAAKKRLDMQYFYKGKTNVLVNGDSFRLKQILVNLLSNAIKYTSEGSITLSAEMNHEENTLQVEVTDTGAGISPEQQENLFSKYYQTNSSKGQTGTGLGLFICKQLVELQGGKINVKSKPDVGSTFSFVIPYRKSDQVTPAQLPAEKYLQLPQGLNILAVDDNELNLAFLKMMISKWNVAFYQATDGRQALDIIAEKDIHVVLTDIQMPVMDGYELLAAIRAQGRLFDQLPVIVVSGESDPDSKNQFLMAGFSGAVIKPIQEAALLQAVLELFHKG
jgi:signal transduction histidine kinase/CheY-like chemotaxis protein